MTGLIIVASCAPVKSTTPEAIKIAVIADIHLSNVYGQLKDSDYKGLKNVENGKYAHIRTMESQLHSTRIFNENYFAFLSAMDNVVDRNMYLLASIFNKFLNGAPSDHFQLNLNSGTIISLKQPIYENE